MSYRVIEWTISDDNERRYGFLFESDGFSSLDVIIVRFDASGCAVKTFTSIHRNSLMFDVALRILDSLFYRNYIARREKVSF